MRTVKLWRCNYEGSKSLDKEQAALVTMQLFEKYRWVRAEPGSYRVELELNGKKTWVVITFTACTCPIPTRWLHYSLDLLSIEQDPDTLPLLKAA